MLGCARGAVKRWQLVRDVRKIGEKTLHGVRGKTCPLRGARKHRHKGDARAARRLGINRMIPDIEHVCGRQAKTLDGPVQSGGMWLESCLTLMSRTMRAVGEGRRGMAASAASLLQSLPRRSDRPVAPPLTGEGWLQHATKSRHVGTDQRSAPWCTPGK